MGKLVDKTQKLSEAIDQSTRKVLLVFWHGVGDVVMFLKPLAALRSQYPHVDFKVGLCKGLDEETIIPDAVLLEGDWREKCVGWDYDIVFAVNFNCEDINNPAYTKAELSCINELGISPVAGHQKIAAKGIVGVSFQCTSVPDVANADEASAGKIWQDIIDAGYIPVEMNMRHVFFNPENKLYPFVDKHLRDWPARLETLIAMISKCDYFVSAVGGPLHLAISVLGQDKVMFLQKDIPPGCFVKGTIASANLKDYKNDVKRWLLPANEEVPHLSFNIKPAKYSYIVAADYKYVPELCACLNSLDYVKNEQDVAVVGINLPKEFTDQFSKLNYSVNYLPIGKDEIEEARGISEITCRKRYWYAAQVGLSYGAVCVLDADLIFVRNPERYFAIAEKTGFILGVTKEQNKVYDDDHHLIDGKWLWNVSRGYYNRFDMCNCPLFLDSRRWYDPLVRMWAIFLNHGFKAADMDAQNLCLLDAGLEDNAILLPNIGWLGTNEKFLKPHMRAIDDKGLLKTESGEPIFSYHGHYYHEKWRTQQLINRHNCASGYLKTTECPDSIARGAMELLYSYFLKMLDHKIVIEKKDYRV